MAALTQSLRLGLALPGARLPLHGPPMTTGTRSELETVGRVGPLAAEGREASAHAATAAATVAMPAMAIMDALTREAAAGCGCGDPATPGGGTTKEGGNAVAAGDGATAGGGTATGGGTTTAGESWGAAAGAGFPTGANTALAVTWGAAPPAGGAAACGAGAGWSGSEAGGVGGVPLAAWNDSPQAEHALAVPGLEAEHFGHWMFPHMIADLLSRFAAQSSRTMSS